MRNKHPRGFTLIELLVVIAIIGILASIVLVSLNSARAKGRDAKRVAELGQIVRVLTLHANADSSTSFAGCAANGAASDCTLPDLSQFNDPSSSTACTSSAAAACDYAVSDVDGTGAASFNDWQIRGYLETGAGAFATPGKVCVSSATSTPYRTGCN